MEAYYYNRLNREGQAAYHAMKTGLLALASSFSVPHLAGKELSDIYFMLRLDCPQIFYTVKFKYKYVPGSGHVQMFPEYLFEKKKIQAHQKAMRARVEKLTRQAASLQEKEKLLYIHDFICENVHYDKLKKPYSHEVLGPLGQGVGVCEGIAKAVKLLCEALGIWCMIAVSENHPEKQIRYRHAWNIVRIGGQYYHLDATFDNTLGKQGQIRHDYFLLSDKQIFRDHEALVWKAPSCPDGEHFYYKEKKMSFTKMEEVRKRTAQAAKKGKILLFHWRGGFMTREIVQEMMTIFEEEAKKKEKHAKVYLNWPQAVVQVCFEREAPAMQLQLEEANEGERIPETAE